MSTDANAQATPRDGSTRHADQKTNSSEESVRGRPAPVRTLAQRRRLKGHSGLMTGTSQVSQDTKRAEALRAALVEKLIGAGAIISPSVETVFRQPWCLDVEARDRDAFVHQLRGYCDDIVADVVVKAVDVLIARRDGVGVNHRRRMLIHRPRARGAWKHARRADSDQGRQHGRAT